MRVEDKKTASSVKPKAEASKVTNNVDTAILPADPLDDALRADTETPCSIVRFEAPSGHVFILDAEYLTVITDKREFKLCSYIEVEAEGSDRNEAGRCRLVRFKNSHGKFKERIVTLSELVTQPNQVLAQLVDAGLSLYCGNSQGGKTQGGLSHIVEFITTRAVHSFFRTTDSYGWLELGKKFIIPNATFGDADGQETIYNGETEHAPQYGQGGTLQQWQDTIGTNAKHSSRVAFAVCMAFASPLLRFTNEGSGGFHLVGKSSKGKSTALRAGVSVWGQVLEDGGEMKVSWNATGNGLELAAKSHTDLPLFIDELGQGENARVDFEQVIYMLGNGVGKRRMTKDAKGSTLSNWRLLFLSAGEYTAAQMMERLKRRDVATGAEIRMATIDAIPVSEDLGVFESVPRGMNSKELADTFAEFGSRFYGTAGVAFMEALIADVARRGGVEVMREHIAKGVADWVNVHARHYNGQILRVAKRFALVAVAGELATEYGVLPWSTGEASNFADTCFRSFVENFETSEQKELRLCQGVIDYVVAFPENFNSVYPDGEGLYPATNPRPLCGTVIYGATLSGGVPCDPAVVIFLGVGMKRACGEAHRETMAALKSQKWLVTNNAGRYQYKTKGSQPIRVGNISIPTGYVVIPAGAYPPEVRKFLENTVFAESRRANVGLGQKTG